MNTIILKFVVEDDDAKRTEAVIQESLSNELNSLPLFGWYVSNSSNIESKWYHNKYKGD